MTVSRGREQRATMHTLVLGGTRSGKSGYAERLAAAAVRAGRAARVRYLATAAERRGDPEWAARLRSHRRRRPETWHTVECGDDPASLTHLLRDADPDDVLLVDDLGGWVTALHDAADWTPGAVDAPLADLVGALRRTRAGVVMVSPEVGLAVVPDNPAARRFADALGTVNRTVADGCDGVVLVAAGQPLWIRGGPPSSLTS